jgi:hypothetical protein
MGRLSGNGLKVERLGNRQHRTTALTAVIRRQLVSRIQSVDRNRGAGSTVASARVGSRQTRRNPAQWTLGTVEPAVPTIQTGVDEDR